jgi:hypothetical protein
VDFSKFKTNDWLVIGGGLGMLIFGTFLDWQKVSFGGFSASGGNAFDFFFTGTIPWILLIGAAVVTFLRVQGTIKDAGVPWPMVIVFATLLAAVLLLIRIVFNPGAGDGVDRAFGMILSVISGLVAAAGGVMSFTAGGGNIKDLADVNKIKGAFVSGDKGDKGDATGDA